MIMRKYEHKLVDAAFYRQQRDEGMYSEGRAKGRAESKAECARNLVALNVSLDTIMKATGFSKERLDGIRASMQH
ncbi:MAG: hypothetical protein LBR22_02735 [Desulfovibrio sp.]|jgi:predicted transposase/invertase (TIGR01784 family)|nr:hypothetical protein [Desulfovibrio sp.]